MEKMLFLFLFFIPVLSNAQGNNPGAITGKDSLTISKDKNSALPQVGEKTDSVYTIAERPAEYVGGVGAMYDYIKGNLNYPAEAVKNKLEGKVLVYFEISKTGKVGNEKVMRGAYPSLDEEALRVVREMPDWIPAIEKGKYVRMRLVIPISFKLQ